MRPTFLSFQTAARAMAASQAAMDVTGNNISNVNTKGYSRQRVDLNAIASSGYTERYSTSRAFVDSGVEVAGISQIRDPFLDARFRKENAENSRYNTLLSGLSDLEGVIDEASVDKLQNEFTNFVSQLQALYKDATSQDLALVTRTAAQKITEIFNSYASQIDEIRSQEISDLTDVVVAKDFNSIVQNIASLNKQIRTEELYGNKPNDLYDARNNLLDELSGIANIKVTTTAEKVSTDLSIERLTVSLYDASTGTSIGLVDADSYNTLSVNSDSIPLTISLNSSFKLDSTPPSVDPADITKFFTGGSISGYIDLINGNGVYADTAAGESSFRGTPYYTKALDTFASKFADVFNKLNDIGGTDGTPNTDNETPLFSSGTGGGPITARNIQISTEWLNNPGYLNTTRTPADTPGAGDNITRMIDAMTAQQEFYKPPGGAGNLVFTGSFHQYAVGLIGELSLDVELNGNFADASDSVLQNLYDNRESISGVLMDEEGINLMAYQKSYNAAARYFTVLDEAVDVLINKMGIVGR
ncbi:MAG TPA: flagellar hook-associated protein FlgK [Anaerovoracaceae bacterium]|nr:flagellar hook-associated protein FlgK [Anaerovoracaceae bacterium]